MAVEKDGPIEVTAPGTGALIAALRAGTRDEHDRLEKRSPLRSADLGIDRYRQVLAGFLGIYRPLEPAIGRALAAAEVAVPWAPRALLLERDLGDLGMTADQVAEVPDCPLVPSVDSPGEALGCLYVLEGATLGGRVIARELGPRLGVAPGRGGAFFHGHGSQTAARWRELLETMEHAGRRADVSHTAAVLAAVGTFRAFSSQEPAEL
jgi:heme oxygenase